MHEVAPLHSPTPHFDRKGKGVEKTPKRLLKSIKKHGAGPEYLIFYNKNTIIGNLLALVPLLFSIFPSWIHVDPVPKPWTKMAATYWQVSYLLRTFMVNSLDNSLARIMSWKEGKSFLIENIKN